MLRNMAASLLRHETIRTTLPKAKELRRVVEPLITLGKTDSDAQSPPGVRAAARRARSSTKLFDDLGPRFKARPGGYTRILHMVPRPGDNAPMALMQLVDGPQAAPQQSWMKAPRLRRRQATARRSLPPMRRPPHRERREKGKPPRPDRSCADLPRA